jgi:hypothetical protein
MVTAAARLLHAAAAPGGARRRRALAAALAAAARAARALCDALGEDFADRLHNAAGTGRLRTAPPAALAACAVRAAADNALPPHRHVDAYLGYLLDVAAACGLDFPAANPPDGGPRP